MAIEELSAGVDRLTQLLEHRKRYFRIISMGLLLSVLMNFALGAGVLSLTNANAGADCRANARAEYDTLRDDRDSLFADGLVATVTGNDVAAKLIERRLAKVRARIIEVGPLKDVYRRAGC